MQTQEAINVLVQAAKIGQSRGVFTLEDSAIILSAINTLQQVETKSQEPKDDTNPSKELASEKESPDTAANPRGKVVKKAPKQK